MLRKRSSNIVRRTSPEKEQADKDAEFLRLTPGQRLKVHEQLRKKIWGKKYNATRLAGLKVRKKPANQ
jgi:hypothetical protein